MEKDIFSQLQLIETQGLLWFVLVSLFWGIFWVFFLNSWRNVKVRWQLGFNYQTSVGIYSIIVDKNEENENYRNWSICVGLKYVNFILNIQEDGSDLIKHNIPNLSPCVEREHTDNTCHGERWRGEIIYCELDCGWESSCCQCFPGICLWLSIIFRALCKRCYKLVITNCIKPYCVILQSEGPRPVMVSRTLAGFTLNIIDTPGLVEGGYVNDQALEIIKRFVSAIHCIKVLQYLLTKK